MHTIIEFSWKDTVVSLLLWKYENNLQMNWLRAQTIYLFLREIYLGTVISHHSKFS